MSSKSPAHKIFNAWYKINQPQIVMHYKNYLTEALEQNHIEEIVSIKQFAFDILIADIMDSQGHKPTLLFDPIPIVNGNIQTEEQLRNYIKNL